MKTVSTSFALLILILPLTLVSIILIGIIYINLSSLDTLALFESIATLVQVVLVNLLVWERLRESFSKKLEYIHDNALFKLHQQLRHDIPDFSPKVVKKARLDLERYGKFILIRLYPKDLLNGIDDFLRLCTEFSNRFERIKEHAKRLMDNSQVNTDLLQQLLGLKPKKNLSSLRNDFILLYTEKCKIIRKEQEKTMKEMENYLEKAREKRKSLFDELEDFIKTNNLSLKWQK